MRNTDEVQAVVQFYRELGLVSEDEVAALSWLLAGDGPYSAHLAVADSVLVELGGREVAVRRVDVRRGTS